MLLLILPRNSLSLREARQEFIQDRKPEAGNDAQAMYKCSLLAFLLCPFSGSLLVSTGTAHTCGTVE